MKKKLLLGLCLLLGASLVGCGSSEVAEKNENIESVTENNTSEEKVTLNVGVINSISLLPLLVAEEQGYFEAEGVEVNLSYFKAAKDRDAALQAGELDGVLCDQIAISMYQNAGLDMQITGKTDGGFTIVAGEASGIESLEDIAGKKVAISENTVIEFTLDKLLEQAGLTADSVEKVAIPSMPTRLEMLTTGEIDAAVMPNPFSDTAIANGGKALANIEGDSDLYISVTAFNKAVIKANEAAIAKYYRAYNQAVNYINHTDIAQFEDVIIETIGYPETMRGNIVAPTFHENTLPTAETVEETLKWCREKGLLEIELTADQIMYAVDMEK